MEELKAKPWVSQYPEQIPTTLESDFELLPIYLKKTATEYPNKKALNFLGKEMTFKEIYVQSLRFANYLRNLGIKKGDRVAIMLPNSPQAVIAYYGILFADAIIVQTNPLYTERELEYQMNDSGATAIICLDLLINRVHSVKNNTKLKHIFVTSVRDYLPIIKKVLYPLSKQPKAPESFYKKYSSLDCGRLPPNEEYLINLLTIYIIVFLRDEQRLSILLCRYSTLLRLHKYGSRFSLK